MNKLKSKLKIKDGLKKKIQEEANSGKDTRFLNYFDLKDGEKMHILFVPDVNKELWTKYKLHGPNLKVNGVRNIRCSDEARQIECPACQYGYSLLNEGKEDENDYEEYKEEAKRWFSRELHIAQCIVLESPFEVQASPDGNQVKLMHLPFAVKSIIEESVIEGLVDEDKVATTPFVLKNKKTGTNNGYKTSYYMRNEVEDKDLEYFDDLMVEPYDFESLDCIPENVSESDVQVWLDKAMTTVYSDEEEEEQKEDEQKEDEKPARSSRKPKKPDPESKDEEDEKEEEEEKGQKASDGKKSSLRNRLKNMER